MTEMVRYQLHQLNVHMTMKSKRIHPRVLKEVADVITEHLKKQSEKEQSLMTESWPVLCLSTKRVREDPEIWTS